MAESTRGSPGVWGAIKNRLRFTVGRTAVKAAVWTGKAVQFMPGWVRDPVREFTIRTLVDFGYKNSAVYACIRVLAESFPEPELHVWESTPEGERVMLADHPLRQLLARPNPFMAEDEFWEFCITYAAVGGNFYIWKERDGLGMPIALWPFHDGQIKPVLDARKWISHYELDIGEKMPLPIPAADIIHWRWSVDPRQPQIGMSPLVAAARAVDTDSELSRFVHALAFNDAVPRTLLKTKLSFDHPGLAALKAQWKDAFGGANRGDVAIIADPDASVERVGANLQELAVEAVHNIPESRVAAVYGGAAVGYLAGLNVHLQRSTFSNYEAAELALHTRVLMAKWRSIQGAMTKGLLRDFTDDPALSLGFDTQSTQALAGQRQAHEAHALAMYSGGLWSRNESRARTGKPPLVDDIILEPASSLPASVAYAGDSGSASAAAVVDAVQQIGEAASPDISLNGAQIASLLEMIGRIGTEPGFFPRDTVVELIVTAFSIPRSRVEEILAAVPAEGVGVMEVPPPAFKGQGRYGYADYRAKAARKQTRARVDVSAVRASLLARRKTAREFEDVIADALEAQRNGVLAALDNWDGRE